MAKLNLTISLPEQKLGSLSFAKANAKGIQEWLHDLPFSNTAEMSNQLYMALGEISKLKTSPQTRLELLKLIQRRTIPVKPDGADLDDLGTDWVQTGGLQVKGDKVCLAERVGCFAHLLRSPDLD